MMRSKWCTEEDECGGKEGRCSESREEEGEESRLSQILAYTPTIQSYIQVCPERGKIKMGRRTTTLPLAALPSLTPFFSPGLAFFTFGVSPVGGRQMATYATCRTASGARMFSSAGTGSATMDLNWKA